MNTPAIPRFRDELQPSKLLSGLLTGLIVALLEVPLEISFAALIFTGLLAPYISYGIGYLCMGAVVLSLVSALLSSYPGSLSLPQDTSAVIIAAMAASISVAMGAAPANTMLVTVLAGIVTASLLVGVIFLALGKFRLGNLIRYFPYPVIGGFLAGTGLLLFLGGLGVSAGVSVTPPEFLAIFQPQTLARWLPTLAFALVLYFSLKRFSSPFILPMFLLAAIIAFFGVLSLVDISPAEASRLGLLMGPFPEGNLWRVPPISSLVLVDWQIILQQGGQLITLVIISTISLLLNAGGFELIVREDINLNNELRAAGISNVAAAFVGSIPGYLALSISALGRHTGGKTRLVGVFTAGIILLFLLFGAPLIALFPRMIAGGLVCYLGITFLAEWIIQGWKKLSRMDFLVVILIMTTMVVISPLAGVGIGLLLAAVLFIVQYSRINVVKHVMDGKSYHSIVERPPVERMILRKTRDWLYILELHGFIFFGTAQNLLDMIHVRLHNPELCPPRFLILDFRMVSGMDASAVMSFVKLRTITIEHSLTILFTNVQPFYQEQLERELRRSIPEIHWKFFPDLDRGIEWCEDKLLSDTHQETEQEPTSIDNRLAHLSELFHAGLWETEEWPGVSFPFDKLAAYLERQEFPANVSLIHQGDPPVGLYIIVSGQVTAQLARNDPPDTRLRVMGPGTVVGELSLYMNICATASVLTTQPTVVQFLSSDNLKRMEKDNPSLAIEFHKFILCLVGDRLRTNSYIIQALTE
jgi:SulP family sulfate permease